MNASATLRKDPSSVAISKFGSPWRAWPTAGPAPGPQAMRITMAAHASAESAGALGEVGDLLMTLSVKLMRSNLNKVWLGALPTVDTPMPHALPKADPDDCRTSGSIAEEQDCHRPVVLIDERVSDC